MLSLSPSSYPHPVSDWFSDFYHRDLREAGQTSRKKPLTGRIRWVETSEGKVNCGKTGTHGK